MRLSVVNVLPVLALAFAVSTTTVYAQPPADDPIAGIDDATGDMEDLDTLTVYRLPEGRRCTVGGETFQCFNLAEYQVLLEMDQDLHHFQLSLSNAQEQIVRLERINTQLTLAIDGYESQIATLQAERTRLFERWEEENRLRLEAENRPMIGSWVAWGLAAAEAAVILGLVIAMVAGG